MPLSRPLGSGPCAGPTLQSGPGGPRGLLAQHPPACARQLDRAQAEWVHTCLYPCALLRKADLAFQREEGPGGQLLAWHCRLFEAPSFSLHGSALRAMPLLPGDLRGQVCVRPPAGACVAPGPGKTRPRAQPALQAGKCWSWLLRGPGSQFQGLRVGLVPAAAQRWGARCGGLTPWSSTFTGLSHLYTTSAVY